MSATGPTAGRAAEWTSREFQRDTSQLADIRRFVRAWFHDQSVPADVVDDFELAISELATNATQHGSGATIHVELAVDDAEITAVVSADTEHASRIGSVESWKIAPPEAVNGRGLGIVAAVMDVVEFADDGGRAMFRCRKRR